MPRKKVGFTFVLVELPDGLIAKVDAERGEVSRTAAIAAAVARAYGVEYETPKRGFPPGTAKKATKKK
jgi:hypothetical protein